MGIRQDLIDYRVAIKRRYAISDEIKQKIIDAVLGIIEDPESSDRDVVAAAKVILAAEQQNQSDEKLLNDNARILEFAERIGIREEVIAASKTTTGGSAGIADTGKQRNIV